MLIHSDIDPVPKAAIFSSLGRVKYFGMEPETLLQRHFLELENHCLACKPNRTSTPSLYAACISTRSATSGRAGVL